MLTPNLYFARYGDALGGHAFVSAMVDVNIHHAKVLTHEGTSCRLEARKLTQPNEKIENIAYCAGINATHNSGAEDGPRSSPVLRGGMSRADNFGLVSAPTLEVIPASGSECQRTRQPCERVILHNYGHERR